MFTAIENSIQKPALAYAAQHASRTAGPLRIVTNANLEARERLQSLGFAVQVLDAAALNGPSSVNIDADIVVLDRSLTGTSLNPQKVDAPVVFINGLASPRADYGSDVIKVANADLSLSALKLAATLVERSRADHAEEGVTCGNLTLRNARAFWNGVNLGLTIGEYKIVELLASRPGHFFPYRAIYDRLRHEGFVAGEGPNGYWANVRSAIKRIRNKFRAMDAAFDEIENYTGFGYGWRRPD